MAQSTRVTHTESIQNGQLGRFKSQGADKLRGGYYTSAELANWLCNWAIRSAEDRVLEPSCGDGVFLSAALKRFAAIGEFAPSSVCKNLRGIEIIPEEAEKAREYLRNHLHQDACDSVHTGDFFEWWQQAQNHAFDAVVGNPPFIRYQSFPDPYRTRAMEIMAQLGLKPNRLTNMWVPFVAAATASLRPGGRLALILPAELLQVSYAGQLRSFLADRFSTIDIITCNELFFDKAEQEVILLLADGVLPDRSADNQCRVSMSEFGTVEEVTRHTPQVALAATVPKTIRHDDEKWLKYLLTPDEITLMRELRDAPEITNLSAHANVDVGVVTGKNAFFVLNSGQVAELGILEYTIPLISRSEQLRGASIEEDDWRDLAAKGSRVHLLHLAPLNGDRLNDSLESYIQMGEAQGVHTGYKCSNRSPWYAVPSVWEPQCFLFRQIYDFPRVVLNQAGATSTDTIHRLNCKTNPKQVIVNTYTYLTAASAEIEGRSYGGGVLELEPTEAERLLMPTQLAPTLTVDECDRLIRAGRLNDLLEENSRQVLINAVGLSKRECAMLRGIWDKMRTRRRGRRRRRLSPSVAAT